MVAKLVIAVAFSLLLIGVSTPAAVGLLNEAELREALQDHLGPDERFALVIEDYERGWFDSAATVRFRARALSDQAEAASAAGADDPDALAGILAELPPSIGFRVEMKHGPILSLGGFDTGLSHAIVHLDPEMPGLRELEEKLGVTHLFETRAVTGLDGVTDFVTELAAFEWRGEAPDAWANFSGFRIAGHYRPETREISTLGLTEKLEVSVGDFKFALYDLSFESSGRLATPQLLIGTGETSIASLQIMGGEARDIRMQVETSESGAGSKLHFEQLFEVASVTGLPLGELADASLTIEFGNVDRQLVDEWNAMANDLHGSSEEETATRLAAMMPSVVRALRASPSMTIGPLRFEWAREPYLATLHMGYDGDALPAGYAPSQPAELMLLLPALQASGEFELPRSAALMVARQHAAEQAEEQGPDGFGDPERQASIMLDDLVAQGLVELSVRGYRSAFEFAGGEMSVNGQALPIAALMQAAMSQALQNGSLTQGD